MLKLEFFDITPREDPQKNIPPLSRAAVHIWQLHAESLEHLQVEEYLPLLTEIERKRAEAFVFPKDKNSFVLAQAYIRKILSLYTSIAPTEFKFRRGAKGKPFLANAVEPIQFNISHSKNLILFAVALQDEVGIDVEYIRSIETMDHIVQREFSPKEREEFESLMHKQEQSEYFFKTWTTKEAYLKWTGVGMRDGLNAIEFEQHFSQDNRLYGKIIDHSTQLACLGVAFAPRDHYFATVAISD